MVLFKIISFGPYLSHLHLYTSSHHCTSANTMSLNHYNLIFAKYARIYFMFVWVIAMRFSNIKNSKDFQKKISFVHNIYCIPKFDLTIGELWEPCHLYWWFKKDWWWSCADRVSVGVEIQLGGSLDRNLSYIWANLRLEDWRKQCFCHQLFKVQGNFGQCA